MTMYIEKNIEDENTGADVKYHEITALSIDYKNNYASVTVESYISLKAKRLGKLPVGQPVVLSFTDEVPAMTENPVNYFYQRLTQPAPEGYIEPAEEEKSFGWTNPYLFADGKVKEA